MRKGVNNICIHTACKTRSTFNFEYQPCYFIKLRFLLNILLLNLLF